MGLVLGIFSSSDTIEGVGDVTVAITRQSLDERSYNPVRDEVFGGNEMAYVISELGISVATGAIASRAVAKSATKLPNSVSTVKPETGDVRGSTSKTVNINNPILDNVRTGSALKDDSLHAFNDIIDNYAGDAMKFSLIGGDGIERTLYQIEGSLNGKQGIFEWIIDPSPTKGVTHRRFIEGVGITGRPNARP